MDYRDLQKIFGVGPTGAVISLALLAITAYAARIMGYPVILPYAALMKTAGMILVAVGLGLHFWSAWTLRNWWVKDRLCTHGPLISAATRRKTDAYFRNL